MLNYVLDCSCSFKLIRKIILYCYTERLSFSSFAAVAAAALALTQAVHGSYIMPGQRNVSGMLGK